MAKFPQESASVYFEIHRSNDDALVTPSVFSIRVKDPSGSTRISYQAALLFNLSLGKYRYYWQIPDAVLPGEWHVEIQARVGVYNALERVYFPVEE